MYPLFSTSVRRVAVAVFAGLCHVLATMSVAAQDDAAPSRPRTSAEVMEAAQDAEWRRLDPENTMYLRLASGEVVIELAPTFAPRHVANIRALIRGGYFDGGSIRRSQDNYVVQWGPRALADGEPYAEGIATSIPAEFEVRGGASDVTTVPDGDVYAPAAGFYNGFPVGYDADAGVMWMAHCYGVLGVARGGDPDSGSGTTLYAVIGHAPRHLDRNLSMVGRVIVGMEHLSTLPRGTGNLGFYESVDERAVIESVRIGSDMPAESRAQIELLRTDSQSFRDLIMARRSRTEAFFVHPTDRIEVCNVAVPVRDVVGR